MGIQIYDSMNNVNFLNDFDLYCYLLLNRLKSSIILLLFILVGISPPIAFSQDKYPSVNIVSPTASSLGKHVDFPVSLHTGVPEINIPIYTVTEGPLTLPISLSYHASGLKVMEPSSWVGAGWSLNAGGVVSRTIKGLPDEEFGEDNYSFYTHYGFSNYFLNLTNYLNTPPPDYDGFHKGTKDGEPDLFTFSFGGYGGKFYIREDQTPVLFPESDLKIELILKPGINTYSTYDYIQGFKITTPEGVKYYFGVTAATNDIDPVEKSTVKANQNLAWYPSVYTSWYLNKIESADGEFQINFVYRKEDYGYYTISTQPYIPSYINGIKPAKVLISGVSLNKIEFSNGFVEFVANNLRLDVGRDSFSEQEELNDDAKTLDVIRIKSNQSTHCVNYSFTYDYFNDDSQTNLPYVISQWNINFTTDRKRLKLNTIQQSACDGTLSAPPYTFRYYDEQSVPRRLSFSQDHWGFNNGAQTNTWLIPPVSANGGASYYPGDNREASWPAMRAGALRMIEYPTGGGTEYFYEPNSASTLNNCSFSYSGGGTGVSAGMGTNSAEFGLPITLTVNEPSVYFYRVTAMGAGSSGRFYIDNGVVAKVNSSSPIVEDYIFLNPGTYTLKCYANQDSGSGVGVLALFYTASASCDPPKEKLVGGLRVKKINKFGTNDSPHLSVTYDYEDASLYSIPVYIFKVRNDLLRTGITPNGTENGCKTDAHPILSPSSAQPLQSVQGYHIGYKKVKEIYPDGGYSVYQYKGNFHLPGNWRTLEDVSMRKVTSGDCYNKDPIYPFAPLSFDFERGNLKLIQVFDKFNRKLKETSYTEEYNETPLGVFGVITGPGPSGSTTSLSEFMSKMNSGGFIEPSGGNPILVTHYDLKTARLNWAKQVDKIFDETGNYITNETTTFFGSDYHNQPIRTVRTSQQGIAETIYRYAPDLTQCNYECPTCASDYLAAAETLWDQFFLKDENCKINICNASSFLGYDGTHGASACYDVTSCRVASWIDYQYRLNQARIAYTNCIKTCKQNNTCVVDGINNSTNIGVKSLYLMEQGNLLDPVESTVWQDNILQVGTFFDYKAGVSDPSKIYLDKIYTTEIVTPTSVFNPATIVTGTIQKDSKYNSIALATYLHNEGQLVEIKERSGVTTSFIWGLNHSVPIVKAVGANYSVLNTEYINSPSNFRNASSLSGAQINTYTYDPVVGITSITDANGKVMYYEYDKLGRLIRIKDHDGKVLEQFEYTYRIN